MDCPKMKKIIFIINIYTVTNAFYISVISRSLYPVWFIAERRLHHD